MVYGKNVFGKIASSWIPESFWCAIPLAVCAGKEVRISDMHKKYQHKKCSEITGETKVLGIFL